MPVEDFNGTKIFEGFQNAIYSAEDTTELFENNASMISWILIAALFLVILAAAVVIVKTLITRAAQGKIGYN